MVSFALRNISRFPILIGIGSERCGIMYRRIEEVETSNLQRQKQTTSESYRKGKDGRVLKTNHHTRRNRSRRDRKRGAVARGFDSDNESSDIHLEDEDEDEDDIMGYTRIRLACRPSVKWNTTDCHGSLKISRDGLGLHAIGQENIREVSLGWSARATIPFFCQTVKPTFSYFEIEVIDGGIGK
jgi:hypothetical protein